MKKSLVATMALAFALALATPLFATEEVGHHGVHHRNHVGFFASGFTTNLHSDHTDYTLGLDYSYRLTDRVGVGGLADFVFASHRETILAGGLFFHPSSNIRTWVTPGVLFVDGVDENPFVARFGIAYDVHAGRATFSPVFNVDVIDGHVSLVYGFGIGFGF